MAIDNDALHQAETERKMLAAEMHSTKVLEKEGRKRNGGKFLRKNAGSPLKTKALSAGNLGGNCKRGQMRGK